MTLGNMRANDLYPNENRFATGFPAGAAAVFSLAEARPAHFLACHGDHFPTELPSCHRPRDAIILARIRAWHHLETFPDTLQ